MSHDSLLLVHELNSVHQRQLYDLLRQQWWGAERRWDDVCVMLEHSSLIVGLIDPVEDQLVGFCRVLTDFAFRGTIYDVIVANSWQGHGLGTRLMQVLCDDQRLQRVSHLYLACEPELESFYGRFGFTGYSGRAGWMMKIQRAE